MNQYEFDLLLQKYLAGTCSDEEKVLVMTWYQNQGFEVNGIEDFELENIKYKIWDRIESNALKPKLPSKFKFLVRSIAASIVFLFLGFGYFFFTQKSELTFKNDANGVKMTNNSSETKQIFLEDGSVVKLASNSSLSYSENFGKVNREVVLTGEAFFNVKKDAQKPFIVHSGDLVTQVLGTSFRIKPNLSKSKIEVSVATGRVSIYGNNVFEKNKKNGILLTPNQKIIYNTQTKEITPSIVDHPIIITKIRPSMVFEDIPVKQVIKKLSESYGIEIIILNEEMGNCIFTGYISEMNLLMQIDILCKTIGANFEQRGAEVFLFGKGCNL